MVLELLSVCVAVSPVPIASFRNRGRGWVWTLVPRRKQSALKAGSGTRGILSESMVIIGPQGIAKFLNLTQPHLPTLRPFQEFKKKINTILASTRLQFSAFTRVTVPLTYGEVHWLCSLLSIDIF